MLIIEQPVDAFCQSFSSAIVLISKSVPCVPPGETFPHSARKTSSLIPLATQRVSRFSLGVCLTLTIYCSERSADHQRRSRSRSSTHFSEYMPVFLGCSLASDCTSLPRHERQRLTDYNPSLGGSHAFGDLRPRNLSPPVTIANPECPVFLLAFWSARRQTAQRAISERQGLSIPA